MFSWIAKLFRSKPVVCEWNGKNYPLTMKGKTADELRTLFNEYAPKAPICVGCEEIIFPGTPVAYVTPGIVYSSECPEPITITKTGLAHFSRSCTQDGNFCGWVTEEGKVRSPFGDDFSVQGRIQRTGEIQIINLE